MQATKLAVVLDVILYARKKYFNSINKINIASYFL